MFSFMNVSPISRIFHSQSRVPLRYVGVLHLNELDQFIKHNLKIKYDLRYADDFLILSGDNESLQRLTVTISQFL